MPDLIEAVLGISETPNRESLVRIARISHRALGGGTDFPINEPLDMSLDLLAPQPLRGLEILGRTLEREFRDERIIPHLCERIVRFEEGYI